MKKHMLSIMLLLSAGWVCANQPDSVYVKGYTTAKNNYKDGLHLAYSLDGKHWQPVADEFSFLKSDYGRWGAEKRMINPQLLRAQNGTWHCLFDVNERDGVVGVASSKDLILWTPQDYYVGNSGEVDKYLLSQGLDKKSNTVFKVPYQVVQRLVDHSMVTAYKNEKNAETAESFAARYADLKPVGATLNIDQVDRKPISDKLIGVFFEDINYAADGGLYAELIQNRDFEYTSKDKKEWNSLTAWTSKGSVRVETANPLHDNNKHYALLGSGQTLINEGFNGIAIQTGEKYDFSVFVKASSASLFSVRLIDAAGKSLSNELVLSATSRSAASGWKKIEKVLTATATVPDARLEIKAVKVASGEQLAVDMVSLFPQKTFRNRKNGLRKDLAQMIADIKPRFVRFPGGCVAHGNGMDNIYNWKHTIGKLEERKPDFNLWGYHQTKGLGYFEYFQYCEDIGAEPLPVLAAGVPCQNSAHNHATGLAGQQGGIPMEHMDEYVQDVLDLIEWATGDKSTVWGRKRAEAGHPKPFHLKYLGIGNEDLISTAFKERFDMIYKAVKAKYPEITVIGTVGPFYEGSDYEFGWDFASKLQVPMVDEHYYVAPTWMINNQRYYDKYDRSKPKVYLGEYATWGNTLYNALSEALHLCNVERNADVVSMTSYAPLLAKEGFTQWNPDLIYFNNTDVKPTINYEVQKLFGNYSGEEYIASDLTVDNPSAEIQKRIVQSVVRNKENGNLIVKLVNLLPVETTVGLSNLKIQGSVIKRTVLRGTPSDKKAVPVSDRWIPDGNKIILPAYSFVVLELIPPFAT